MKKHKIYALAIALLVACAALTVFLLDYYGPDKVIARQYAAVHVPEFLHEENKTWRHSEDMRDDALFPAWDYTYGFPKSMSRDQVKERLREAFTHAGYTITGINDEEFTAQSKKISAHVIVGLDNRNNDYAPKDVVHAIGIWVVQN